MRLESSIRHNSANHKAILGSIVQRIIDELNNPEFSGDVVSISIEDPVHRREFEYAIKLAKHTVEYGMNREILKIAPLALFEVILANIEDAEERFKDVVQACIKKKTKQREVLDKTLTVRQKVNKLGKEITSNSGAVALLSKAVGFL